jgi:ABC-type multidrug transport system ATPase subunit
MTSLDGVFKRYGSHRPWVLEDVGLTLEAGTLTAVVGGNGSGKSTLLRIVAGASVPSRGTVRRAAPVAYVPERLPPEVRLSARRYLTHLARIRGVPAGRGGELLERFGLSGSADVPIGTLSKGNTRKVTLCQAFLRPAALTVLDEPFSGLDGDAAATLSLLVAEARAAGGAVLVSTHAGGSVADADRELRLDAGRLTAPAPGTPAPGEHP